MVKLYKYCVKLYSLEIKTTPNLICDSYMYTYIRIYLYACYEYNERILIIKMIANNNFSETINQSIFRATRIPSSWVIWACKITEYSGTFWIWFWIGASWSIRHWIWVSRSVKIFWISFPEVLKFMNRNVSFLPGACCCLKEWIAVFVKIVHLACWNVLDRVARCLCSATPVRGFKELKA